MAFLFDSKPATTKTVHALENETHTELHCILHETQQTNELMFLLSGSEPQASVVLV